MDNLVPQRLRELLSRNGRDVLQDPARLHALLLDYCPQAPKREIHILVNALREQVPTEILHSDSRLPRQVVFARLTRRLQENFGADKAVAGWAVETWANALSAIDADEQPAAFDGGRLMDTASYTTAPDTVPTKSFSEAATLTQRSRRPRVATVAVLGIVGLVGAGSLWVHGGWRRLLPNNRPPDILIAQVDPAEPVAGGTLTARVEASDPDGEPVFCQFRTGPKEAWQLVPGGHITLVGLSPGILRLEVRAVDSRDLASAIVSNDISVTASTKASGGATDDVTKQYDRSTVILPTVRSDVDQARSEGSQQSAAQVNQSEEKEKVASGDGDLQPPDDVNQSSDGSQQSAAQVNQSEEKEKVASGDGALQPPDDVKQSSEDSQQPAPQVNRPEEKEKVASGDGALQPPDDVKQSSEDSQQPAPQINRPEEKEKLASGDGALQPPDKDKQSSKGSQQPGEHVVQPEKKNKPPSSNGQVQPSGKGNKPAGGSQEVPRTQPTSDGPIRSFFQRFRR